MLDIAFMLTVKNARDTNRMEEELNQAQLDFDTLKPLLSDDDMGIGELDDNMEIPLQMISPQKIIFFPNSLSLSV
jgi:hypothetical protein